jgi:IPT/TIG domain
VRKGGEGSRVFSGKRSKEYVDAESEDDAMSLKRRNIGLRIAGIGVGVALFTLGLAAPAWAAAPTVASFTPTSGPTDCVVVVTGTGFTDLPSTDASWDVEFDTNAAPGINATDFAIISATEIWAVVPGALVDGTGYNIRVSNSLGAGTSAATFVNTANNVAGGCAPTITSFTPTCGSPFDTVTITGTNLIGPDLFGGDVFFAGVATAATTVQPDPDIATSLGRVVPSGVVDGAIKVVTFGGTAGQAFSATSFLTPPPDCTPDTGNEHARSITFKIKKSGAASGVVSSTEDPAFTDCAAAVPVKIQRKTSGGWKTVGKTTTDDNGAYAKKVKNKKGKQKFRALAPKVSLGDPVTDVCLKAKSATRTA